MSGEPKASIHDERKATNYSIEFIPPNPKVHSRFRNRKGNKEAVYQFLNSPGSSVAAISYHAVMFHLLVGTFLTTALEEEDSELLEPEHMKYGVVIPPCLCFAILGRGHGRSTTFANSLFNNHILLVILSVELFLRVYSTPLRQYYQNRRTLLNAVIDTFVLLATFLQGFSSLSDLNVYLRSIQLLRLLIVDRKGWMWRLMWKAVTRHKKELGVIYFVIGSAIIFLTSTFALAELPDSQPEPVFKNLTDGFSHLGTAAWFSLVTLQAIGYGDVVPRHWMSRVSTCVTAYITYCAFVGISTIVALAMTHTVESDSVSTMQGRHRHAAARVIQHWYRAVQMGRFLANKSVKRSTFISKGVRDVRMAIHYQRTSDERRLWRISQRIKNTMRGPRNKIPPIMTRSAEENDSSYEEPSQTTVTSSRSLGMEINEIPTKTCVRVLQFCILIRLMHACRLLKQMNVPLGIVDPDVEVKKLEKTRTELFGRLERQLHRIEWEHVRQRDETQGRLDAVEKRLFEQQNQLEELLKLAELSQFYLEHTMHSCVPNWQPETLRV